MGTNYYWRYDSCGSCERYNEIHVGKSSGTWRAYPHKLMNEENPEWGYQPESPVGFPILSLSDWRRVFTEIPGKLVDEYGKQILDPLAWLAEMRPWKPGPGGRRWLEEDIQQGVGWLDDEGFKFSSSEFS